MLSCPCILCNNCLQPEKEKHFFQFSYWKTLILCHDLDVMHIEKNICDSIVGTSLSIDGKSKDNMNSHLDLEAMGVRDQLHPIEKGNKVMLYAACYSLTSNENKEFCKYLKKVKVPNGYASNISQSIQVNERKIFGLKSHDCHVLNKQLLPLTIHGVLNKNFCAAMLNYVVSSNSSVLVTPQIPRVPLTTVNLRNTYVSYHETYT